MSDDALKATALPTPADALTVYTKALANPAIPKVYGNQIFTIVGAHDISVMFGLNGVSNGVVTVSYTVAKALAKALNDAIANYEKSVKVAVPDLATLDAAFNPQPKA